MPDVPPYDAYMRPIVHALRKLGGSATIDELYEAVVEEMGLTEAQLETVQNPDGTSYDARNRMSWARSYLKKAGFLTNSKRGVWSLTATGQAEDPDPKKVLAEVSAKYRAERASGAKTIEEEVVEEVEPEREWQSLALETLRKIPPAAFERLCQRVLRESGFVEVEVTGRAGDGGIDGRGILRLQRVVSFQVLFQCKRYQGAVGPHEIRDFRGAMVGRSDKGLFITTGTFTRAAQTEATRDGAPPIDLIDGNQFVELLKDLQLGISTEVVEVTKVDTTWFEAL